MSHTVQVRVRLLACFLPLAAVLLVVGEALTPKGLDGLGALGVSFAAIAVLVRERGSTIATVAAVVGGVAGFCGGLANVLVGYDLAAAATAQTLRAGAEQVLVTANRGWAFDLVFAAYLGGLVIATVLMTVALWRSRAVPRWLPILYVVSFALAGPAPAGIVSIPLQLPIAVALVLLAMRVWRTTTPSAGLPRTAAEPVTS